MYMSYIHTYTYAGCTCVCACVGTLRSLYCIHNVHMRTYLHTEKRTNIQPTNSHKQMYIRTNVHKQMYMRSTAPSNTQVYFYTNTQTTCIFGYTYDM